VYCPKCGKEIPAEAQFCQYCGVPIPPPGPEPQATTSIPGHPSRFAGLPDYWQRVFRRFDERPGKMQTCWNWPAFFFGPFWYLTKGLPVKGALYALVLVGTHGFTLLFLMVYAGLYGAWDYYLKEAQGKQLW
jgi:zinc-ribbon domain/Protein of unknown function (DUF2628)